MGNMVIKGDNSNTAKESISLCNKRRKGNQIIKYKFEEANIKYNYNHKKEWKIRKIKTRKKVLVELYKFEKLKI